jgi:hypothetical protein
VPVQNLHPNSQARDVPPHKNPHKPTASEENLTACAYRPLLRQHLNSLYTGTLKGIELFFWSFTVICRKSVVSQLFHTIFLRFFLTASFPALSRTDNRPFFPVFPFSGKKFFQIKRFSY